MVAETGEYLYVARPARLGMLTEGLTAEEAKLLSRHVAHLRKLGEPGMVPPFVRMPANGERTQGLVILRGEPAAAARRVMLEVPGTAADVMRAELHPDRVALLGRDR